MPIQLIQSPVNGYSCPTDPNEPGSDRGRLSINDTEGRILQCLVRGLKVFEIGTGLGVSTAHMMKTAAAVYTYDVDPWVQLNVYPDLVAVATASGRNNVFVCPVMLRCAYLHYFDAAFIDGLHTLPACTEDIKQARRLVKPGGLLIFHDLYVQDVGDAILAAGLDFVHIQTTAGMALAWNEKGKEG